MDAAAALAQGGTTTAVERWDGSQYAIMHRKSLPEPQRRDRTVRTRRLLVKAGRW